MGAPRRSVVYITDKCKGIWTRVQNNSKSVLDYILIKEEDIEYVKWLMINEGKTKTPFITYVKELTQQSII